MFFYSILGKELRIEWKLSNLLNNIMFNKLYVLSVVHRPFSFSKNWSIFAKKNGINGVSYAKNDAENFLV